MTPQEALLTLNALPKVGLKKAKQLLSSFSSPEQIFLASQQQLQRIPGINDEIAFIIKKWDTYFDLKQEVSLAEKYNINICTPHDGQYPQQLNELYDQPFILYYQGELPSPQQPSISVIGTRASTFYGEQTAKKISYHLGKTGFTIVSGLARGIDSIAHQAAIAAQTQTVGIIGSGLCEFYPEESRSIAEKILTDKLGCIVSEYPLTQKPTRYSFPQRNRLIAAWSLGTLIIESPKKSGSMITAKQALDLGKHIFAVPGAIDHPNSAGCHDLIRNGATLVTCAEDIIEDLSPHLQTSLSNYTYAEKEITPVKSSKVKQLNQAQQLIYKQLSSTPIDLDFLLTQTQLEQSIILAELMELELLDLAQQLPGNQFVKI